VPEDRADAGARTRVCPGPRLLTYPDSLGGDLASIRALLSGPLAGLFGGIHILPPLPSSAERGFAPATNEEIDPSFGEWDDIAALAADRDVLLDLMVNHISRQADVDASGPP
jgi:glycosidase